MPTSSNPPQITEKVVRKLASGESFQRGRDYFSNGAVTNLSRRGNHLTAQVEGSSYEPYIVDVTFGASGIASVECTCPYDWGGACKHVVAALLAYIDQPEQVEEHPSLDSLLAGLSPEQLRSIVTSLAEHQPGFTELIEAQVLALQAQALAGQARSDSTAKGSGKAPARPQTTLDPSTFRRQVRSILHSLDSMRMSEAYWHVGGIVDSVRQVAEQARPFIEAGDGRSALAILQGVTEAYIADWNNLDDSDGELGEYFDELDELWTEAILTAELTADERKAWAKRFSRWRHEVDDYGIDIAFHSAETAANQGWDHPPLVRILAGQVDVSEANRAGRYDDEYDEDEVYDEDEYDDFDEYDEYDEEDGEYTDTLTHARLNILERQGRTEEYLNLARAKGLVEHYAKMLIKLGRVEEASEYALQGLGAPDQILGVAQALRDAGAVEQALRIAQQGLTLDSRSNAGGRIALARWVRDFAENLGRRESALEAALVAVREAPSLDDYQAAQALAGEPWPQIREELLKMLHNRQYASRAQIEIYLYEGLIDDAIAAISGDYVSHELVDMVVDGALKADSHHDWVIEACRRQAEAIIDASKSQLYEAAARWLRKAKSASIASGREAEWRAYVQDIIARHKRKRSLVPLLEALLKR